MASNGCVCGCEGKGCKSGSCSGPTVSTYQKLRWQLDELGYQLVLPIEAVPLVSRLVADLLHTTTSLGRFKEAAQNAEQQLSAERKKSCSRRVESTLQESGSREGEIRDLSARVRRLEADVADARFLAEQRQARVRALERESADKSRLLLRLQSAPATHKEAGRRPTLKVAPAALPPGLPAGARLWTEAFGAPSTRTKDPVVVADDFSLKMMAARLAEESRAVAHLHEQVRQRDQEICRLTSMMAPTGEEAQHSIENLRAAISTLEESNTDLRAQLQDALRRQHEAMMRAVRLAERNQVLEAELKDVDGVAMSVEASCTTALRESSHHVTKLQDQLSKCQQRVTELERELTEFRCNGQNLLLDVERLRLENEQIKEERRLGRQQKTKGNDQEVARLHKIEIDLTAEIERLVAKNTFQKRRIVELEERLNQSKAAGRNSCGDHCAKQSVTTTSSTCKKTTRSTIKDSSYTSRKRISSAVETRNTPVQTEPANTDYKIVQVDLTSDKEDSSRSRNVASTQSSTGSGNPYGFSALNGRHTEIRQTVDTLRTTSSRPEDTMDRAGSSRKEGQHAKSTNHASRSHGKSKERSSDAQERCTHSGNGERKVGNPHGHERLYNGTRRFR